MKPAHVIRVYDSRYLSSILAEGAADDVFHLGTCQTLKDAPIANPVSVEVPPAERRDVLAGALMAWRCSFEVCKCEQRGWPWPSDARSR